MNKEKAAINETKHFLMVQKINQIKSWCFKRTNKRKKPLANLIKEEEKASKLETRKRT